MNNKLSRFFLVLVVSVLGLSAVASAQTSPGNFTQVKIANFGQMDEGFYRGAQPLPEDFKSLQELGVKTVIDLRGDPTDYEKSAVESLGMKYVNIPMSGFRYPKEAQLEEFLKLVNNPETGKIYVHCKAGIHRTGVAGAVYRFSKYNWDYDKVYQEMKNYDFYTGFFHGAFKSYVKDYSKRMIAQKLKTTTEQTAVHTAQ